MKPDRRQFIAGPNAFFTPIDRFNEGYDELRQHPDWSLYGEDYPAKRDLLEQRNRVIERHPKAGAGHPALRPDGPLHGPLNIKTLVNLTGGTGPTSASGCRQGRWKICGVRLPDGILKKV